MPYAINHVHIRAADPPRQRRLVRKVFRCQEGVRAGSYARHYHHRHGSGRPPPA